MKRLIGGLIVSSETRIVIIGTLLISAGINLITSLDLLTANPTTFYDALRLSLAAPFIYLGIVVFALTRGVRNWEGKLEKFQEQLKKGEVVITERNRLEDDYKTRTLASPTVVRCIWHVYVSISLFVIPTILSLVYICKEWTFMRTRLLSLILAALAFFGCTRTTTPPAKPVVLGYQQTALYRHLFTAKEKGFFEQEGLTVDLQNVPSGNGMMEGLVSGQLDGAGLVNLQVGLTVHSKDPNRFKFVNFQVWGEKSYPDYILVRVGSNIKSLKDIEGHTMGLHPGSAVKAFSRVVLQHFNVNVEKVKFIELEPSIMQSAVTAGRVDAVYAMDPVATTLIESGQCSKLLPNPMQYISLSPVPISGSALSTKFLDQRPQDVEKVMRALDRAITYMREAGHEDEIAGYIAKYTPITKEMALKLNPSEYWTQSETDRSRVQALADRFQELGIIPAKVDINGVLLPIPPSAGGISK